MSQPLSHKPTRQIQNHPSRAAVIEWVESLLPELGKVSVQQLGDGEAYCRILNRYSPSAILPSRIINAPKNQYECALNLKHFQTALCKLKLNIPFDINRVSKKKFNQNWALAIQLYRALQQGRPSEQQGRRPDHQVRKNEPQEMKVFLDPPFQTVASKTLEPTVRSTHEIELPVSFENCYKGSLLFTIDRVKEVILSNTHDTEKIRRIRQLLGLERDVKVEEQELIYQRPQ